MPLLLRSPWKPASLRVAGAGGAARPARAGAFRLKALLDRLDAALTAVAFAEEDEPAAARQILASPGRSAPSGRAPATPSRARTP